MKRYFLIIYVLLSYFIYAQLETAHWFFGNHAGLDFTSRSPIADTNGALYTHECCSSISDKNGNLLFYTDGSTVYNKNHSIMSNDTGLLGNSSSTQSGLIIPDPYTPTLYYIFSVHTNDISPTNSVGIHYSLVDMTLDSGNGAVISGKKIFLCLSMVYKKVLKILLQ
ncbi:hypothetical protein [Apibacter adventoris]|uniref:Uncharacterized protein n=1 Tax=Apibacter adventoris TaxID=1679466 RepID=A0A2S8AAG6_9FLAO|nr:hypothetical protein [Apibacter adventoris]PQL91554.1 hypothetical protein C4S77_07010 [Apibacter adventoris]PQL93604.1 hypothetical protein C4S76_08130 [Apibacter adventoris]